MSSQYDYDHAQLHHINIASIDRRSIQVELSIYKLKKMEKLMLSETETEMR